jgi:hypothetical protein
MPTITFSRYWDVLVTYLAPQRRLVLALALALCGDIGLQLPTPQVPHRFIDTAPDEGAARALTCQALGVAVPHFSGQIGWRATTRRRGDLLRHCLGLDRAFHHAHPPGQSLEPNGGDGIALDGDPGAPNQRQ